MKKINTYKNNFWNKEINKNRKLKENNLFILNLNTKINLIIISM